jgi:hypothetical protein
MVIRALEAKRELMSLHPIQRDCRTAGSEILHRIDGNFAPAESE